MALKHNKKKNSLIIYEQLLTLASRLATQKKQPEFDFVVSFAKKHFVPTTNIGKERRILQNLTEAKSLAEFEASQTITECLEEYKLINFELLEKEKVRLINEINSTFGSDFFKIPIKSYKLYASAQILLNENKNGFSFSSPAERAKIKNLLKENLLKRQEKEEELVETDNLTYNLLINKFNKKYGSFINSDQKQILSSWIKYQITEDEKFIVPTLNEKIQKLIKVVNEALKNKNSKSTEYYELLKEAQISLGKKNVEPNESFIYEIMRYCDLAEELTSKE